MKKTIFILAILVTAFGANAFSQDYSKLKDISLKSKEDCTAAEDRVKECTTYILTTPMDDSNQNRMNAIAFVMRWMDATPDFTFDLDQTVAALAQTNESLLGVYMACMSKFVLENRSDSKDKGEVKYRSVLLLLDYAQNPDNKVDIEGELENLVNAKKDGTLKDYLKINQGMQV
jgi:hypothetical protein